MQNYLKPYVTRAGIIAGVIVAVIELIGVVPFLGGIIDCLTWPILLLVIIAAGVLAVMWGKSQGAAQNIQQGAIDGAIAGGIAGILGGIVGWLAGICRFGLEAFVLAGAVQPDVGQVLGPIFGGCLKIIGMIVMGVVLGAIAGLVYAAIQQNQKKTA